MAWDPLLAVSTLIGFAVQLSINRRCQCQGVGQRMADTSVACKLRSAVAIETHHRFRCCFPPSPISLYGRRYCNRSRTIHSELFILGSCHHRNEHSWFQHPNYVSPQSAAIPGQYVRLSGAGDNCARPASSHWSRWTTLRITDCNELHDQHAICAPSLVASRGKVSRPRQEHGAKRPCPVAGRSCERPNRGWT